MKTLHSIFFLSMMSLLVFTSCKKDEELKDQLPQDNIVGEWVVSGGEATAYIDGTAYRGIKIETEGDVHYDNDNTGQANFSMSVAGEVYEIVGSFEWEKDGFEIVWSKNGKEDIRWSRIDNESNMQKLSMTHESEDSNDEVELTITMLRK